MATLSDNSPKIQAPRPLQRHLSKLKRLARSLSRKKRESNSYAKAKTKLAKLYGRTADIRADALHKLTSSLTRFGIIVIEDLNVSGMLTNRRLSRVICDVGLYEFRRQLEYKAAMAASLLVVADQWFPSSKLCSACGVKKADLTLAERWWKCEACGVSHDRDRNAAYNLARYPESWAGAACGAEGTDDGNSPGVEPAA